MNGIVLFVMWLVLGYSVSQVTSYLVEVTKIWYEKRQAKKKVEMLLTFIEDSNKTDQEVFEMIISLFGTEEEKRKYRNGEYKIDFVREKD